LTELLADLGRNVPFDGIIIALGTDDLLMDPEIVVEDYLEHVAALVERIASFQIPIPLKGMAHPHWVLVIAPPTISPHPTNPNTARAKLMRELVWESHSAHAAQNHYALANGGSVIRALAGDGLHLDLQEHRKLGMLATDPIRFVSFTTEK
jgi:hypothetical protein